MYILTKDLVSQKRFLRINIVEYNRCLPNLWKYEMSGYIQVFQYLVFGICGVGCGDAKQKQRPESHIVAWYFVMPICLCLIEIEKSHL